MDFIFEELRFLTCIDVLSCAGDVFKVDIYQQAVTRLRKRSHFKEEKGQIAATSPSCVVNYCAISEFPAGVLLLVHICVVLAALLRSFSHGSPSREVVLRNAAGVSGSAEQTPLRPRLPPPPPSSSPPCLSPPRLFVQRSVEADFCEGHWVTCR